MAGLCKRDISPLLSYILVNIGSGKGLVPARGQIITQTNTDLLTTGPLGINLSEI